MSLRGAGAAPELSIIVLGYRAGDSLRTFVGELDDALIAGGLERRCEIILVANYWPGTPDRTPIVARELAAGDPRIRVVATPKSGDMGWDMRSGLRAATGDHLAVIDGDGQMPAADVVAVYRRLRESGADVAKTYRQVRADGLYRRVISAIYNGLFALLFPGLDAHDINSKPKVMTRRAYEQLDLHDDGWFIDAEIMIQARRLGLRLAELPTHFESLHSRPSFVRPRALVEFFVNLLAYRARDWRRPRRTP